jgi:hypothetical protein
MPKMSIEFVTRKLGAFITIDIQRTKRFSGDLKTGYVSEYLIKVRVLKPKKSKRKHHDKEVFSK